MAKRMEVEVTVRFGDLVFFGSIPHVPKLSAEEAASEDAEVKMVVDMEEAIPDDFEGSEDL